MAAGKAALTRCRAGLLTAPFKSLSSRSCVLFAVGGQPTGLASPIGIPFGTVREGP